MASTAGTSVTETPSSEVAALSSASAALRLAAAAALASSSSVSTSTSMLTLELVLVSVSASVVVVVVSCSDRPLVGTDPLGPRRHRSCLRAAVTVTVTWLTLQLAMRAMLVLMPSTTSVV